MTAHPRIEHDHSCPLLSQKPLDLRDGNARLPPDRHGADFADLLTQRRTVNGCKPSRLATSPERSRRVFSVLITRIDYHKYVNLSTVVNPFCHLKAGKMRRYYFFGRLLQTDNHYVIARAHFVVFRCPSLGRGRASERLSADICKSLL